MDHISWLTDVYGPRLTGSPAMQQASDWAMKKITEWGLSNVHQRALEVRQRLVAGSLLRALIEPQIQPLIGLPHEWCAGDQRARSPATSSASRSPPKATSRNTGASSRANRADATAAPGADARGSVHPADGRGWTAEAETTPIPAARVRRVRPAAARRCNRAGGGRGDQAGVSAEAAEFMAAEGVVAIFERGSDSDMSPAAATCRGSSSVPTAARSFPPAPARATRTPAKACRKSRWRSNTTTA